MNDLTRVAARMLDLLRPTQAQPRGRPLQSFIGPDETVRLQEPGGSSLGTRYQWSTTGARWGFFTWGETAAIKITLHTGNYQWSRTGTRWGLFKWA